MYSFTASPSSMYHRPAISRDIDAGGTDGGRPCGAISERGGDADDLNFSDVWDGLSPQVLVLVVFTELEVTKMKNKKMDQADSFDLRPASVEEAGLFHPDGETLVGRVTFASGERQEFTDHGAYLQTIWEELPYRNTTGLRHETLTDDPELKKAVDDILLDFAGEENPRRACNYGLTEAGKQALREAADPGRSHTYAWFVLTDCSTPEEQICRNLTLEEAIQIYQDSDRPEKRLGVTKDEVATVDLVRSVDGEQQFFEDYRKLDSFRDDPVVTGAVEALHQELEQTAPQWGMKLGGM